MPSRSFNYENYDSFILDLYGVLHHGGPLFPEVIETLCVFQKKQKNVIIMSNHSHLSEKVKLSLDKKGLTEELYNGLITAGDVMHVMLVDQKIEGQTYYVYGSPNKALFKGTAYQEVEKVDNADFIYLGTPKITEEIYQSLGSVEKAEVVKKPGGLYDIKDLAIVKPGLESLMDLGKPFISANPNKTSITTVEGIEHTVIRQGTLAAYIESKKQKVIQTGKPFLSAYEYLIKQYPDLASGKTLIVGASKEDMVGGKLLESMGVGVETLLITEERKSVGSDYTLSKFSDILER